MKTLLLAAGYATRLYPLTRTCPKPLLDVAGRPVLEYLLSHLGKIDGLDTIYIVVNQKFYAHFENWKKGLAASQRIVLINDGSTHEEDRLGAIGDIRFSIREQGIADDLLVVAGDNLFDIDLGPFIRSAREKSPSCSMMLYDVKDLSLARRYGIVSLDAENRIVSFEEKPENPTSTLSAMGVYYLPKGALSKVETYLKEGSSHDAPGFFIRWLSQQETVYGYPCEGVWYDIGDLASYQDASQTFAKLQKENRKEGM